MKHGIRINKKDFFSIVICLFVLYLSGTTYIALSEGSTLRSMAMLVLSSMLLIASLKALGNEQNKKLIGIIAVFTILFLCVSILNYRATALELVRLLVIFILLVGYLCYMQKSTFDVWTFLYNVMVYVSLVSIVLFFIINVFGIGIPSINIQSGRLNFQIYFGLYSTCSLYYIEKFGFVFYRLQSVFWEPGVYGVALVFCLFYHLFIRHNDNKKILWLIIACLICTLSTTGICVGVALCGIYWYSTLRSSRSKIILFIPAISIVGSIILKVLLDKMLETNMTINSYNTRLADITTSWQIWKDNFIFGNGYRNVSIFTQLQGSNRGSSNGLFTWFYTMGIVGVLVVLIPFVTNIIMNKSKRIENTVLLMVFIVTNMSEPLIETPFMLMIIAYEYLKMMKNAHVFHKREMFERRGSVYHNIRFIDRK